VRIEWKIDHQSQPPSLELSWRESGGPEVAEPERKGFGSIIIGDHLSSSLRGTARTDYHQDGFQWGLTGPLEAFLEDVPEKTEG